MLSYIAETDRPAAERFGQKLLKAVDQLEAFPESGRAVPEFEDPDIREIVRKPCRIVYRVDHEKLQVEIARIWHAARGTPEL